jgi:hypothetical protein
MAKKEDAVDPVGATKSESGGKNGYGKAEWAGHDLFQCKTCPFTSFVEADMQRHIKLREHTGGKYARRMR